MVLLEVLPEQFQDSCEWRNAHYG